MSAAQQPSAVTAAHCASATRTAASFTASETTPLRPTAQAGTLMRVLQQRSRVNRPSQQEYLHVCIARERQALQIASACTHPNGLRSVAQQASHGFWLSKHEGSFAQRNMVGALVAPAAVIAGFGELQQASAV